MNRLDLDLNFSFLQVEKKKKKSVLAKFKWENNAISRHLINGNVLGQHKKVHTRAGSAVTPLLFEVTIILFQKVVKLLHSEFQHSKMTDEVGNTK